MMAPEAGVDGDGLHERRLSRVIEKRILQTPEDLRSFIPSMLTEPFTTSELARVLAKSQTLAQKIVYCLRLMGCITPAGKQGRSVLYRFRHFGINNISPLSST